MQDLRVIGVENGALLVASDDGTRFRIPIDEVLQSKLRQTVPDPGAGRKLAPKDIQAHIRSGMSAQDVASITGVPLEYIQRFEGPVIAEREFVVQSALDIAVHTAADTDPMRQGRTFGTAIRARLHEVGGINERWASWKDPASGWIVKLSFTANQIDHDARWQFDPKKHALAPLNNEAITLSQQGDDTAALMPRLRAVSPSPSEGSHDPGRFDSGAFTFDESTIASEPVLHARADSARVEEEEPVQGVHGNQTADLLEALRRRRGEREALTFDDSADYPDLRTGHPSAGPMRIVDSPIEEIEKELPPRQTAPQPISRGSKRGRAAMPSWDEIVFGARPDDDLA